ncbi:MAG: DUF1573 domain-containing protein, partial [Phycisphaerae bacterium]
IVKVKADCHCTTPGKFQKIVPPGETTKISFVLDTRGLGNWLTKGVTVTINDPKVKRFRMHLQGFVKTVFKMTPNNGGNFGEVVGEYEERSSQIIVTSRVDETLKMDVQPIPANRNPPFTLTVEELEPGKKWKLLLTTKPPLPVGYQVYQFAIRTGHDVIKVWPLRASFFRPQRVAAKPMNIRFPDVYRSNRPLGVDIHNHGTTPVTVTGAEIRGNSILQTSVVEVVAGKQYRVEVQPPLGYSLPKNVDMFVKTDDPEIPEVKVTIFTLNPKKKPAAAAKPAAKAAAQKPDGGKGKPAVEIAKPDAKPAGAARN